MLDDSLLHIPKNHRGQSDFVTGERVVVQSESLVSGRSKLPTLASRGALLLVVLGAGLAAGIGVATGFWQVAIAAAVAIPIAAVITRDPFAGVLAWLLLVPYVIEQLTVNVHPLVWALHRLAVPGLLLLVIAYHSLGIRRSPFRLRAYDLALAAFLGGAAINIVVLTAQVPRTLATFYDQLFVPIVFFWLVRAIGPGPADVRRLTLVGAWTVVVQATIGILSWIVPDVLPGEWLGRAGMRTVGTFGGPAMYTITLVLFAALALYAAMSTDQPRKRFVLFGVVVAAQLGVLLSLSRGSWLGAGLTMLGIVVLYRQEIGRFAVAAIVLATFLVLGPVGGLAPLAQERLATGDTIEGRIVTNDAAVRMIEDRPLVGFGYGNFERFDERYKQRVGDTPLILGGSAHNTYLNMLVELGIPATVLYLVPALALLWQTYRLWRRHRHAHLIDWRLVAILWLVALDQFVVNNFLEIIHSSFWATSLWWITLGLIAVQLERLRATESQPYPPIASGSPWEGPQA